jgi:quinoprotein relay system zinc metallohydrolase 1
MNRAAVGLLALGLWATAGASALDYQLKPRQIAEDTYLFEGHNEDFSADNGGNIVNTAFIVTTVGVVVINAGPSKLYGEQMKAAIGAITNQPVVRIFVSKLHPDHFLGSQAFPLATVSTLPETIAGISTQGEQFALNMYRLAGPWMIGTDVTLPNDPVQAGIVEIGGHRLELMAMSGHTPSDLVILDHTTGTLFTGGVVFHDRAPTTPHADLDGWRAELDELDALTFQRLVPSHGPVAEDHGPIQQTRNYVNWLDETLRSGAENGLDMAEVLETPLPDDIAALAVMPVEFHRSVTHLYPALERTALPRLTDPATE